MMIKASVELLASLGREVDNDRADYTNPAAGPQRIAAVMRDLLKLCTGMSEETIIADMQNLSKVDLLSCTAWSYRIPPPSLSP